jgi:hypothetical protein
LQPAESLGSLGVLPIGGRIMAKGAMKAKKEARKPKKDAKKPAAGAKTPPPPVQAIRLKDK